MRFPVVTAALVEHCHCTLTTLNIQFAWHQLSSTAKFFNQKKSSLHQGLGQLEYFSNLFPLPFCTLCDLYNSNHFKTL